MAKAKSKPSSLSAKLKPYLKIMESENLQELEISEKAFHVKLVRQGSDGVAQQPLPLASHQPEPLPSEEKEEPQGVTIESPIAGVFYRSPAPNAPVFVEEGKNINPGQVVCIVEAMKVMNQITADKGGRVKKILVENGKPVEAGTKLFLLDPS